MEKNDLLKKYLYLTHFLSLVTSLVIMASCIFQSHHFFKIFIPIIFWISIILEFILIFKSSQLRKELSNMNEKIGLLRFFQTQEGKIADITFVISTLLYFMLGDKFEDLELLYGLLTIMFFSFQCHCIFNGKNFIYIKSLIREEKKDANNNKRQVV